MADPKFAISDAPAIYDQITDKLYPSQEDIACELQLQVIGDWEPLDFSIDQKEYQKNVKSFIDNDWFRPFQPREGIINNRESVLLYGLEGDEPTALTGLSHIHAKLGYKPREYEFSFQTKAAKNFSCMKSVFDYYDMGRSFFIRLNAGGFYPWHRDHMYLKRDTIRLIAFLGEANLDGLAWEVNGQRVDALPNHVYYVDTRKSHRLHAQQDACDMVVMNVRKDWLNVNRILSHLKYR